MANLTGFLAAAVVLWNKQHNLGQKLAAEELRAVDSYPAASIAV